MSKKDYVLIAKALADSKPMAHWDANKMAQWTVTVNRIADALQHNAPKFNRARFVDACNKE